jgi:8-oxo-dGTP diphosphatase
MATQPDASWPKTPLVGVGCVVVREDGQVLMVQNHRGLWSTPGGHLDFGESPAECAARETFEETGLQVTAVEFAAITNDVLPDAGQHYITIWMRADAADSTLVIRDPTEIAAAVWFAPNALPEPRHLYFENLLAGRSLPPNPTNLPFQVAAFRAPPADGAPNGRTVTSKPSS